MVTVEQNSYEPLKEVLLGEVAEFKKSKNINNDQWFESTVEERNEIIKAFFAIENSVKEAWSSTEDFKEVESHCDV